MLNSTHLIAVESSIIYQFVSTTKCTESRSCRTPGITGNAYSESKVSVICVLMRISSIQCPKTPHPKMHSTHAHPRRYSAYSKGKINPISSRYCSLLLRVQCCTLCVLQSIGPPSPPTPQRTNNHLFKRFRY